MSLFNDSDLPKCKKSNTDIDDPKRRGPLPGTVQALSLLTGRELPKCKTSSTDSDDSAQRDGFGLGRRLPIPEPVSIYARTCSRRVLWKQ